MIWPTSFCLPPGSSGLSCLELHAPLHRLRPVLARSQMYVVTAAEASDE